MMGAMIEFQSNGSAVPAYLARPENGGDASAHFPGVIVIQEWWGLVAHIKDVCDRFAEAGFVAVAPDFYRGETTSEPNEAQKKMMALQVPEAIADMSGAVDFLLADAGVSGETVGVIGFCMGGGLALCLAAENPLVSACVAFYGVIPWADAKPDLSKIKASVLGHYAELDASASPAMVSELEGQLQQHGVDVEMNIYQDVEHAFFNDTRPEVHDEEAAKIAWQRTVQFLRAKLKG